MGSEKRRRKSGGAPAAEPAKQRRVDDEYPTWKDHSGYTVLKLENNQSVLFVGEATLQVLHGAVRVSGKLISVDSPPLVLSTGGRFSLAITITAESPVFQIPLAAAPLVEVSLQSRPPEPTVQQFDQQPGQLEQETQGLVWSGSGLRFGGDGPSGSLSSPLPVAATWGPPAGGVSTPRAAAASGRGANAGAGVCTFSLYKTSDPRAPASLVISREWAKALDDVCASAASGAPLVLAVLGAKGTGKSSLCRLVANRLLDLLPELGLPALALLDTDVGQPELTPPGLLSLHLLDPGQPLVGPPHAHARPPWAARFVGDVSPQHDPQLYLSAVQALYGTYWDWAQSVLSRCGRWPPLVVNTHGWVKGLGFDLLTQLLRIVAPSHVIQIRSGPEKKNLPGGAFWCGPAAPEQPGVAATAAPSVLITLQSLVDAAAAQQQQQQQQQQGGVGPSTTSNSGGNGVGGANGGGAGGGGGGACPAVALRSLKPVESRALAWHAWAKRVVGCEPAWGSYESDDFWRNAGALASLPPWRISLDDVHVQLLGGSLPYSQLGRLLNGAVVGLLATSNPSAPTGQRAPHPAPSAPPWNPAAPAAAAAAQFPPGGLSYAGASSVPPPLLPCLGLGIVRAVDMSTRSVYVLTDVEADALECVGALVVGRLELPGSLVVGGQVASPYQQLFGLSAEATGAGAGKARKNLSRSSLVDLAG